MPQRLLFRIVLPALLGAVVGFFALAYAVPNEPTISPAVVALFSPGLKVAEMTVPVKHESLAFTFGWFLRIAIFVNTTFYFVLFALLAYWFDRRHKKAP